MEIEMSAWLPPNYHCALTSWCPAPVWLQCWLRVITRWGTVWVFRRTAARTTSASRIYLSGHRGKSVSLLSLVELLHYCALIGREDHSVGIPVLLCHKEPAQDSQSHPPGNFLPFVFLYDFHARPKEKNPRCIALFLGLSISWGVVKTSSSSVWSPTWEKTLSTPS